MNCNHDRLDAPHVFRRQGQGFIFRLGPVRCLDCGASFLAVTGKNQYSPTASLPLLDATQIHLQATEETRAPDPAKGLPGTEMMALTQELEIESKPGCGCKTMAAQMDRLGVQGCRRRINNILMEIEASYESWGWRDKLHACTKAAWKGVGLGVNPIDPIKSLIELSIDRAEQKLSVIDT